MLTFAWQNKIFAACLFGYLLWLVSYFLDGLELNIAYADPAANDWVTAILEPELSIVSEDEVRSVWDVFDTAEVIAWGDVLRCYGDYLGTLYQTDVLYMTGIIGGVVPDFAVLALGADAGHGYDVAAIGTEAGADGDLGNG